MKIFNYKIIKQEVYDKMISDIQLLYNQTNKNQSDIERIINRQPLYLIGNNGDISTEFRMIIDRIGALKEYLDVNFVEEMVFDDTYVPEPPRKIKKMVAKKNNKNS